MLGWKNYALRASTAVTVVSSQRHAEWLWWEIRPESKARAFANSKHHLLKLHFSCTAIMLTQSSKKEDYSTRHIFKLQNHQVWAVLSCSAEKAVAPWALLGALPALPVSERFSPTIYSWDLGEILSEIALKWRVLATV